MRAFGVIVEEAVLEHGVGVEWRRSPSYRALRAPKKGGPDWARQIGDDESAARISVLQVLRPVRFDLLDQRVRQRHVVQRLGLRVAFGIRPK